MRLTLIVAATEKLGIGKNGSLPWRLKKEMQYFARVTMRVPGKTAGDASVVTGEDVESGVNAVIMGRKTWDSIPTRFRPLKERVNVVLTSNPSTVDGVDDAGGDPRVFVADSLDRAIDMLVQQSSPRIQRVFIIGGSAVYRAALENPLANRVLLTHVFGDNWNCDTFFPVDLEGDPAWRRASMEELKEWTGESMMEADGHITEGGVHYEYRMYIRSNAREDSV